MIKPIEIRVGGAGPFDPVAGGTNCNITTLAGVDGYLEKTGYGPYPYEDYQVLSSGGFRLLDTTFVDDETFYFHPASLAYGTASSGSYSNGFNLARVMSAMFGRIGWRQTSLDGEPVLNSNNLTSRSGRYFNDGSFHALVTVANIKAVMEDSAATTAEINTQLEVLQRSIIMRTLTAVFGAPEYKSQALAFDRRGNGREEVPNSGKFVAVKITVPPAVNRAVQIDSVALMFNEAVTFPLYLYSDLKSAALWTSNVTAAANSQTIVSLPDIILNHIGSATHGGVFYLGYYQDDLGSAKAIRDTHIRWGSGHLYGVESVEVSDQLDWQNETRSWNTYGINPHLSVFVDHTEEVVKKAALFDNAVGLGMSVATVEQILFSKRINAGKRILADGIDQAMGSMALEGVAPVSDSPSISGLRQRTEKELARVRDSFNPKPQPVSVTIC